MKQILIIIASIAIISCTKEMPTETTPPTSPVQHASVERILVTQSVTIDSVKYKPVYAGSNMSLQFSIYLSNVSGAVSVTLYRESAGQLFKVANPTNGLNILYDRLIHNYPTAAQNMFYYFVVTAADGSLLTSDKFQVY